MIITYKRIYTYAPIPAFATAIRDHNYNRIYVYAPLSI